MTALLLSLALCAQSHQYTAEEASQIFGSANDAFLKGELTQAVDGYRRLIADGYDAADVHYNLGNTLLAEGHPGPAILEYQRARRLDPADEDITANLDRARRDLVDKVAGPNEAPVFDRIALLVAPNQVGWAALGLYLVFWLALGLRRFLGAGGWTTPLAIVCVLLAIPIGAIIGAQVYLRTRFHAAVVVAASDPVREGPSASSKVSFEIHEGTELRVLQREGEYARVRLFNGLEGWAPAKDIEEI
jgi:tetratricopeptide (TPR) repeat protein